MTPTHIYAAIIEDEKGEHHQFHAFSEEGINALIAGWCRERWEENMTGPCPEADTDCLEVYFENKMMEPPGFEHTLTALDPIEIPQADPEPRTYPIEIYVNGALEHRVDSTDAETDLKGIKATLVHLDAVRSGRKLTDLELYGTDDPYGIYFICPAGVRTRVGEVGPVSD